MSTFTIDNDNHITAYTSAEQASQSDKPGVIHFDSPATLSKVSTDWPMSRFVEIWNGIAGQTPLKKVQDLKKAIARVWSAIQPLASDLQPREAVAAQPEPQRKAVQPPKQAKEPAPKGPGKAEGVKASDRSNKKSEVIAMMTRPEGTTLAEIMQAIGWQKHTVRGFVSLLGSKGGQSVASSKNATGERTYKISQ